MISLVSILIKILETFLFIPFYLENEKDESDSSVSWTESDSTNCLKIEDPKLKKSATKVELFNGMSKDRFGRKSVTTTNNKPTSWLGLNTLYKIGGKKEQNQIKLNKKDSHLKRKESYIKKISKVNQCQKKSRNKGWGDTVRALSKIHSYTFINTNNQIGKSHNFLF